MSRKNENKDHSQWNGNSPLTHWLCSAMNWDQLAHIVASQVTEQSCCIDEPAHLVLTYTIPFLPLYHFPSIVDTPATQHACASSHATPMSLHNCSLTPLTLIGPVNPLHHWTSFVYGMYRWPRDLMVTFSFSDWSPCCFSDDYFFFQLTNLPPWYATVPPCYLTRPNVGRPVPSHCTTQSVSQGTVAVSLRMILVFVFPWQVFCI